MQNAIILFAHGSRDADWAQPVERIGDELRSAGIRVELAFLEFMQPTLDDAAARLAAESVKRITVVPVFLAQGGHLKRELPELVKRVGDRHLGTTFSVTPPLGDAPEVIAAIAAWIRRVAS